MERSLEEIEQEIESKKNQQLVETKAAEQSNALQTKMDNTMMELMENVVEKNKDGMLALTDKALKNEINIRETQTEGRKKKEKSKVEKEVAEAKTEEDQAKHERAKTILKAQGLTSQLPKAFRITALIIGYPFFVLYLLTLGWIIEFFTFVIQGFITMVADCVERFTEVNAKIIANDNSKDFKLGKAISKLLWGLLIVGAIIAVIVLFVVR